MTTLLESLWSTGWAGYLGLALGFMVAALLPIPRTPLVLAAGLAFGVSAAPVITAASALGGMAAFALARWFLRAPVRRLVARYPMSDAVLRAVDLEGVRIVALLRLYGPLPSTVQNYAFGLTTIGLWPFAIVSLLASIPQIVLYCYLGALGRDALRGELGGPLSLLPAALGLLCFGAVIAIILRRVRAILSPSDAIGSEPGPSSPRSRPVT